MKKFRAIWLTGLPCSGKTTLAIAKKLYQRALKGEIKEFTGISAPFEGPDRADIVVDTENNDITGCVKAILDGFFSN